jgi:hypothetical protein
MQDETHLAETLGRELHELVDDVRPRAGLVDAAIARRRTVRHRALTGTVGVTAAVAAALVVALGTTGGGRPVSTNGSHAVASRGSAAAQLQLASYHFSLPRDAKAVPATPATCAFGTGVTYPNDPNQTSPNQPGVGASAPNQPTIASAVTAQGGCVSMLLTDPYMPGSDLAPTPAFPIENQAPITIAGNSGTIGTQELIGSGPTEKDTLLTLELPAPNGQKQLFLAAAAGISQQQLESIVTSGLGQPGAAANARS